MYSRGGGERQDADRSEDETDQKDDDRVERPPLYPRSMLESSAAEGASECDVPTSRLARVFGKVGRYPIVDRGYQVRPAWR
jgi:hypothetical protein